MGQRKGQTGNPNGRPKGTPNKVTADLRQWICNFIDENREQIRKDWQKLEPKERLAMFEKLLKYALPTLQATTHEVDFERLSDEQLDYIIESLKRSGNEQEEKD